jgi:ABC-type antimicrobial peptide transport system permease subunit
MRGLIALALPGIVFGWLTRVPPLTFGMEFDFFANEVGWIDVLAAVIVAIAVTSIVAAAVCVLVKLGVGGDQHPGRRTAR